jgi:hypothetical protein
VYERVSEQVKGLVGPLMLPENKLIKKALADHHRVNRCFDILGRGYPNWPTVDPPRGEVGGKRKWGMAGGKEVGRPSETGMVAGGGRVFRDLLWRRFRLRQLQF